MRPTLAALLLAATSLGVAAIPALAQAQGRAQAAKPDPYIWLEEVSSPRAMAWVEAHNAKSTGVLEADPRYAVLHQEALEIAQAKDRIPGGRFIGAEIYNFWQDADHVRGVWRKASLADYAKASTPWTPVIDLDALSKAEGANWVWKGANCAKPAERLCLIDLSDGGEDAVTVREFDLKTGAFVSLAEHGFDLPKGKQRVAWEDDDTLLISREWKPGELTLSGYPFIVKRLRRGQPLSAAVEVYRGAAADGGYGVSPIVLQDALGQSLAVIDRPLDTFHSETYVLTPKGPQRLAIPAKAGVAELVDGRVIVRLEEDWTPPGAGASFAAGSVVSMDLAAVKADPARLKPTLVYAPGPREAIEGVDSSHGKLLISILDDVQGRALVFTPTPTGWTPARLPLPNNATVGFTSASARTDEALIAVTGFLTPPSLWLADAATGSVREIKRQPPKFDAAGLVTQQFEATSSDGVRIPYFIVHRRDMALNGANPTLLYAYGGFQVSETPTYQAGLGKLWLERGGVYVLANIRGGGEFGPKWHEAGLKTRRQIVYDDFAAVARDLIARQITQPRRLGIRGGSNGGLLMGVQFTQHPELWNAVVIDVPLLDMIRIGKIAAGASWQGEYGDVEADPAARAFWAKTSPYDALRRDGKYPEPFIFTTTKDDRVGPQHARKFAARMEEYGLPFLFYENTEGGHAAGANLRQQARTQALEMTYLTRKLMDDPAK